MRRAREKNAFHFLDQDHHSHQHHHHRRQDHFLQDRNKCSANREKESQNSLSGFLGRGPNNNTWSSVESQRRLSWHDHKEDDWFVP